jgi:hypothetical protein
LKAKNAKNYKESYLVQKNCPKYLTKPFNFYGGYVSLNQKEKATVVESSLVTYYKATVIELE